MFTRKDTLRNSARLGITWKTGSSKPSVKLLTALMIGSGVVMPQSATAQIAPNSIISVCSGVSLPPSVVTGIMDPVLTGIVTPVQSTVNGTLSGVNGLPLIGLLPAPLSINLTGLLSTAASGAPITLQAVSNNGTILGPTSQCNATADG